VSLIGDLATGVGTLLLAVATFASVRSANASARTAERALAAGLRPLLLLPSRMSDEMQKVRVGDGHFVRASGGLGVAAVTDDAVYLAMNLRNSGQGIAVIHGWFVVAGTPHDTT
jgi:hypothetical protein